MPGPGNFSQAPALYPHDLLLLPVRNVLGKKDLLSGMGFGPVLLDTVGLIPLHLSCSCCQGLPPALLLYNTQDLKKKQNKTVILSSLSQMSLPPGRLPIHTVMPNLSFLTSSTFGAFSGPFTLVVSELFVHLTLPPRVPKETGNSV